MDLGMCLGNKTHLFFPKREKFQADVFNGSL
jgi:hypothetical protein